MRLSLVFCLLVGAVGCGGDDEQIGLLGDACSVNNECAAPLICLQVRGNMGAVGMCTQMCANDGDTSCMSINDRALCREMHCTYQCTLGGNCPNGGDCVAINASVGRCVP